jgi:hypothetical protein
MNDELKKLWEDYYKYLIKYELRDDDMYIEHLPYFCSIEDFEQQIKDETLSIKVYLGY